QLVRDVRHELTLGTQGCLGALLGGCELGHRVGELVSHVVEPAGKLGDLVGVILDVNSATQVTGGERLGSLSQALQSADESARQNVADQARRGQSEKEGAREDHNGGGGKEGERVPEVTESTGASRQ